jgi:hypothetical protein
LLTKLTDILANFLVLCCKVSLLVTARVVGESGMIITQKRKYNTSVIVAVYGTPCAVPLGKQ